MQLLHNKQTNIKFTPLLQMSRSTSVLQNVLLFGIGIICVIKLVQIASTNQSCSSTVAQNVEKPYTSADPRVSKAYELWRDCMRKETNGLWDDHKWIWSNLPNAITKCENLKDMSALRIKEFRTKFDKKKAIFPKDITTSLTSLSIGIGRDIAAEKAMQEQYQNITFFGADPMPGNDKVFGEIGTYYPFGISGEAGILPASVLLFEPTRHYESVVIAQIDLIYFLTKVVRQSFFDIVNIDPEGAEYGMFPFMHNNKELDQNGIVFCQMNIEIHGGGADRQRKLRDLYKTMLDDGRYAFFRTEVGTNYQAYIANFAHPECVRRFLVD